MVIIGEPALVERQRVVLGVMQTREPHWQTVRFTENTCVAGKGYHLFIWEGLDTLLNIIQFFVFTAPPICE